MGSATPDDAECKGFHMFATQDSARAMDYVKLFECAADVTDQIVVQTGIADSWQPTSQKIRKNIAELPKCQTDLYVLRVLGFSFRTFMLSNVVLKLTQIDFQVSRWNSVRYSGIIQRVRGIYLPWTQGNILCNRWSDATEVLPFGRRILKKRQKAAVIDTARHVVHILWKENG